MINEIIRQIDNQPELLSKVISLASAAFDELELAETIKSLVEQFHDYEVSIEIKNDQPLQDEMTDLFTAILSQAINSITYEQWLTIANHYWAKVLQERQS